MNKIELFRYLQTIEDKSGGFKKPNSIKKNYPEIYDELKNVEFPENYTFVQKLWHFLQDDYTIHHCESCDNPVSFINFKKGYRNFCSGYCAMQSQSVKDKLKEIIKDRYGVEHYSKTDEYKEKVKETNNRKYGVDNYSSTSECKEKVRMINRKKYGTDYYSQSNDYKSRVDEIQERIQKTCKERYGTRHYSNSEDYFKQSDEIKLKSENTCIERYGAKSYSLSNDYKSRVGEIQERIKEVCRCKYGTEYYTQSDEYKKRSEEYKIKAKCTNKTKYDAEYYSQSDKYKEKKDEIIDKRRSTSLEKYGMESYSQTDDYKNRVKNTSLIRYGTENYAQTDEFKKKQFETKTNNNSFNTSSVEIFFDEYLNELNIPHIRQYRSEKYPYSCDFFIPGLDLYIEIQGSWTHGKHPFDGNDDNDIKTLNIWKQKESKYYDNAIYTWTDLDVRKRNIAKENHLNYLEIFSNNLKECIDIFENYLYDKNRIV